MYLIEYEASMISSRRKMNEKVTHHPSLLHRKSTVHHANYRWFQRRCKLGNNILWERSVQYRNYKAIVTQTLDYSTSAKNQNGCQKHKSEKNRTMKSLRGTVIRFCGELMQTNLWNWEATAGSANAWIVRAVVAFIGGRRYLVLSILLHRLHAFHTTSSCSRCTRRCSRVRRCCCCTPSTTHFQFSAHQKLANNWFCLPP